MTISSAISKLTSTSNGEEIYAVLKMIAEATTGPIMLDQFLRKLAKATGTGLNPVRQSYDIVLKKLNIKPVDLGLAMAKDLLAKHYNNGLHLRLTNGGLFYFFDKSHWKHQSKEKIRAELQTIAIEYKGHIARRHH